MERDPKTDPQRGDVVERPGLSPLAKHRREVVRSFVQNERSQVTYRQNGALPRTCHLSTWMRWARNGDVIVAVLLPEDRSNGK